MGAEFSTLQGHQGQSTEAKKAGAPGQVRCLAPSTPVLNPSSPVAPKESTEKKIGLIKTKPVR